MNWVSHGLQTPIDDLGAASDQLKSWRAGRIVTADGRLVRIERRWLPYKASRMRVWWDSRQRPRRGVECSLYFHEQRGNPRFLVLGYIASHPRAALSSFFCALLVLDEVARLKACDAIVAEVTNSRMSDRLLKRWGWEQHCLQWRGRHVIKRFYGKYPVVPPLWRARMFCTPKQ